MTGARDTFEYAVLRVVPRIERGESLNAGVLVYCRQRDYLGSRVHLDVDLRWRTLHFSLVSHSAGGVTPLDLQLAHRIDALLPDGR